MTTFFNRKRARIEGEDFVPREQKCSCNRQTSPPHCRKCGSAFKYVRLSESKITTIPPLSSTEPERKIIVKRFICRNCGHAYFEDDLCNAPDYVKLPSREEQAMARRSIRGQSGVKAGRSQTPTGKDIADFQRQFYERFPELNKSKNPPHLLEEIERTPSEQEEFEKWQKGE